MTSSAPGPIISLMTRQARPTSNWVSGGAVKSTPALFTCHRIVILMGLPNLPSAYLIPSTKSRPLWGPSESKGKVADELGPTGGWPSGKPKEADLLLWLGCVTTTKSHWERVLITAGIKDDWAAKKSHTLHFLIEIGSEMFMYWHYSKDGRLVLEVLL